MSSSRSVLSLLLRLVRTATAPRSDAAPATQRTQRPQRPQRPYLPDAEAAPGASGIGRTAEVDPRTVHGVRVGYAPTPDGDPDPGEVVWTWVPFDEADGRGKDRPVLVLAVEKGGTVLAIRLTSKDHEGLLPVGTGGWDPNGRPSYADPRHLLRVHPAGMRREGAALDRARFDSVARAVAARYGWS